MKAGVVLIAGALCVSCAASSDPNPGSTDTFEVASSVVPNTESNEAVEVETGATGITEATGTDGQPDVVVEPPEGASAVQTELSAPMPGRMPITFRHDAPDADVVRIEMTANYWNRLPQDAIEMDRVDDGVSSHAVTLFLGEDQWLYRYRVDGRWEIDAYNPESVGAENGQRNSLLRVGTPITDSIPLDDAPTGTVEQIDLASDVLGRDVAYVLYTPPGNTPLNDGAPVPLLVLLHGYGQPATDWSEAVGIGHYMDNLLADGRIDPFAIAMPSGENSGYTGNHARHIVDEVIPDVMQRVEIDSTQGSMAVGGFSQGGNGALRLAALRPDRFGLVLPIAMAGPCGGLCDRPLYDDTYLDGFDAEFATWVGVDDELGLDAEHDRFVESAARQGITVEDVRSDDDGHRVSGHSIRYVRTIAADVLMRSSSFFEAQVG